MNIARKPLAIDRVWRRLGVLVRALSPIAIAASFFLTRAQRRRYLLWLRPLEAIARRLLFLEILALRQPAINLPAGASRKTQTRPPSRECVFAPHAWRAPFPVLPRPSPRRVRRRTATIKLPNDGYPCSRLPPRPVSAMGVARRIEALHRVIAHPASHARRLSFRLARLNVRAKLEIMRNGFAAPRHRAAYRKSALLLAVVQHRVDAALTHLTRAHALTGWEDSS